ncbi:MAG: hypothetical protein V1729_01895 [Candidatus Woesearchaeota archaeon]
MYDIMIQLMGWAQALLLIAAAFYGVRNLHGLITAKHKKGVMQIKRTTFLFLTPGIIFLTIAFLINNAYGILGAATFPSFADIFFVLSYTLFTIGFAYFWFASAKLHKLNIKEPFFILGVSCAVFIWLYFLFRSSIIPNTAGNPFLMNALDYFYPIIVSLMFLFTLVIHPRLKAGIIRTPLWYISTAIFTYFIAYMIYTYSIWHSSIEFLPMLSTALFMISAGDFALGFYTGHKKYKK